ncbi:hypothetical protein [Oceanobacillus caeni]|uniref:Uncharacterized protein n=1 Tax=Oceanobacillus caeni TaxID=405946 RepID=A0ABR5MJY2_9BACI|nr:hypothetical protein [Oceanobacillus caeni]KPH75935.1 hypothetical protein AFL42_07820 [Oceanobacillus caeni]
MLEVKKYDVIYFEHNIISETKIKKSKIDFNPNNKIELLMTEHYPWNKVIKGDLMENIKFPNKNIRFQDHATIPIVINQAKNVGVMYEALYNYDVGHPGNITKKKDKYKDIYEAFEYLINAYSKGILKKEDLTVLFIKKVYLR